jgi:hypothetical protein
VTRVSSLCITRTRWEGMMVVGRWLCNAFLIHILGWSAGRSSSSAAGRLLIHQVVVRRLCVLARCRLEELQRLRAPLRAKRHRLPGSPSVASEQELDLTALGGSRGGVCGGREERGCGAVSGAVSRAVDLTSRASPRQQRRRGARPWQQRSTGRGGEGRGGGQSVLGACTSMSTVPARGAAGPPAGPPARQSAG